MTETSKFRGVGFDIRSGLIELKGRCWALDAEVCTLRTSLSCILFISSCLTSLFLFSRLCHRLSQRSILLLQDFRQPPLFLRAVHQQGTHRRAAAGRRTREMHAGPQRGGLMSEVEGGSGSNQRVTHFQRESGGAEETEGGWR